VIGSIVLAAKVREKNSESRPALVSSITGVACAKLASAATAVASNHLFARAYGPQQFGQLQLALALAFAFSSLGLAFSDESVAPMKFLDDEVDISYRF
jgi:O-antigen/teichoic acid export membrane protein